MTTAKRAPWLVELSAQYARKLPRLAEDVGRAVQEACQQPDSTASRQQAHLLAHRLAGTAGTYGFDEVGRLARELELALIEEAGPTLDGSLLEQTSGRLLAAARDAATIPDPQSEAGDFMTEAAALGALPTDQHRSTLENEPSP